MQATFSVKKPLRSPLSLWNIQCRSGFPSILTSRGSAPCSHSIRIASAFPQQYAIFSGEACTWKKSRPLNISAENWSVGLRPSFKSILKAVWALFVRITRMRRSASCRLPNISIISSRNSSSVIPFCKRIDWAQTIRTCLHDTFQLDTFINLKILNRFIGFTL